MKKTALLYVALVASLMLFSACSSAGPEANAPVVDTDTNSDTILDDNLFEQATTGRDSSRCKEIADESKQKECIDTAESFILTDKAVAELDSSICNEIPLDRYKENCVDTVKMSIEQIEADAKAQEDFQGMIDDNLAISQKAVDNGDYKICDQIEDENQMYSCKYNVLADKAKISNDPSLCAKIGNDVYEEKCKAGMQFK